RIARTTSRSSAMPGFRSTWSAGSGRGLVTRVRFGFAVIGPARDGKGPLQCTAGRGAQGDKTSYARRLRLRPTVGIDDYDRPQIRRAQRRFEDPSVARN